MKSFTIKCAVMLLVVILLSLSAIAGCSSTPKTSAPATTTAPVQEVITLKYSAPYFEFEPPAICGLYFCDYVEQHSGGRVKFERFTGGQLGGLMEHLELVRSGAVDLITFMPTPFSAELPLHSIEPYAIGSPEEVLNAFYKLFFEIPETSSLFSKEAESQNIKILDLHFQGTSGLMCRDEAKSIADLKGKKYGLFLMDRALQEMGVNFVNVQPPEMFESLSRGVVDAVFMAVSPLESMKVYEVAKSYLTVEANIVAGPEAINLNTWNKLPAEIQKVFMEAANATKQHSIQVETKLGEQAKQTFKDAGLYVSAVPKEETEQYFSLKCKFEVEGTWMENCAKAGVAEQAKVVMKYWKELIGK